MDCVKLERVCDELLTLFVPGSSNHWRKRTNHLCRRRSSLSGALQQKRKVSRPQSVLLNSVRTLTCLPFGSGGHWWNGRRRTYYFPSAEGIGGAQQVESMAVVSWTIVLALTHLFLSNNAVLLPLANVSLIGRQLVVSLVRSTVNHSVNGGTA